MRPKAAITAEPIATIQTTLKLDVVPLQMLKQRIEEDQQLARQVKELTDRRARNHEEIAAILQREGCGEALLSGVTIAGTKVKMVIGTSTTFDKAAFMAATGTTAADFADHTTKSPKTPHLRITGKHDRDTEED